MGNLSDTAPEIDRLVTEIYRNMSIAEKWRRLGEIYRTAKTLHAAGCRLRKPDATPAEIHEDWLLLTLGEEMTKTLKEAKGGVRG